MGKAGKIILTVAIIFGAFILVTWAIGANGNGGALKTGINGVLSWINGRVANFTGGTNGITNVIPTW